ncbi:MAG: TRAP transporter large permease subunit, partial [Pseudomonadota bacterium]
SIAGLFAAGILPGLLMGLMCMAVIAAFGRRWGLPKHGSRPSLAGIFFAFRDALVALVMPVIILGGILGGLVTPTEGAAVAVAYALFIGKVVYRQVTWRDLLQMLERTATIMGIVFLIIASASILSWWMSFQHIPQLITDTFLGISTDRNVIIALVLLLLLFLG